MLTIISIHAPHTRSDIKLQQIPNKRQVFQSTLLIRGATLFIMICAKSRPYFNPRSSYEERRFEFLRRLDEFISIHAPHTRSDKESRSHSFITIEFQSTLLIRGATHFFLICKCISFISIHAPHTRSDWINY